MGIGQLFICHEHDLKMPQLLTEVREKQLVILWWNSPLPVCQMVESWTRERRQKTARREKYASDCQVPTLISFPSVVKIKNLLFQKSESAPVEESNPPISPINIKDEPIDEGYDAALLPQSSIRQIKEELEHQEVGVGRQSHVSPVYDELVSNSLTCFHFRRSWGSALFTL